MLLKYQRIEIEDTSIKKEGVANNVNNKWYFDVDGILEHKTQKDTYDSVASNIVVSAMNGQNGQNIN